MKHYTVWKFMNFLNKNGYGDSYGITIKPFPKGVKIVDQFGEKMTVVSVEAMRQRSSVMGKFNFSLDFEETTVFTRGNQWTPDVYFDKLEDTIRVIFEMKP
jgi:hypothetical protein